MDLEYLKDQINEAIKNHPAKADELQDLFYMAQDEIEDGGSVEHEVSLAMDDLEKIIAEKEK